MSSAPPPPPPGNNPWSTPGSSGTPGYGTPPGYGAPPPPPGVLPGQPMYQYGAAANPWEKRGTTVLVLGILSLVICGLLGPVGWSMGSTVRKEALAAGWPEPGNNKAGRICSIVSSCLLIAAVAIFLLLVVVGIATSSNTSG